MFDSIKRFIKDFKKYREFIIYSTKINLKKQVAGTAFGYLWWLMDPLLHLMVYNVLVIFVFRGREPNFSLFVFCGLLPWKWATSSIGSSTKCIKRKAGIIRQIYLPKFILPLIEVSTNFIKLLSGFVIILFMMIAYKAEFTLHLLEIIPVFMVNFIFLFALTLLIAHWGVLYNDFGNFITHILRLWFYVSPGIYSLTRIPEKFRVFWMLNPMTTFFESYRNVIMYGRSPMYLALFSWLIISLIMLFYAVNKVYSFDKNYAKVV